MSLYTRINNETKKEGQMPLHYPADRVYLDGDKTKTVQDVVNRGSVSVTADGVKTIKDILNELYSKIVADKVTNTARLVTRNANGDTVYSIFRNRPLDFGFTLSRTANNFESDTLNVKANDGSRYFVTTISSAGAVSISDQSTTWVPASGEEFLIEY